MNYYEHHIGDYAEATSHLSFVEDAAYSRLIRKYYALEKALPGDVKAVQRLVGARTKEEKNAVQTVLEEFFIFEDGAWHNERCDDEIQKFLDGEPEREIKKANESNRLKRHREERAALFKRVTDAGHHLPWNVSITELRDFVKRLDETSETFVPPLPATAPATPATATQTPITNTQTPDIKPSHLSVTTSDSGEKQEVSDPPGDERPDSKRNVEIAVLLRGKGVKPFTFAHPLAVEWGNNPKITDELLTAAVQSARDYKPTGDISPNYLKPIIEQLLTPQQPKPAKEPPDQWWLTNSGIDRKGRELGMFARGTESYNDFKDRIFAEIRKRQHAGGPQQSAANC